MRGAKPPARWTFILKSSKNLYENLFFIRTLLIWCRDIWGRTFGDETFGDWTFADKVIWGPKWTFGDQSGLLGIKFILSYILPILNLFLRWYIFGLNILPAID